jgi:hypothetical protein
MVNYQSESRNYYGGGQYQIPGVDPTKTPLGRGEMDQDMIAQLMQLNPQLAQMFLQSQQGFDPMVQNQLNNLPGLQQQILGGSMYGDAEKQTYQDLISGKTLAGQGGTLYDMIQQQFAPSRNEARGYAASMGLAPSSGAGMSMMGNVQGAQDKSFAENMVKQYLNMVGVGSEGLGAMDLSSLQRQQAAGGLGQWMSEFVTGQQNQKTQMGANITQMQQNPLMQLLGLSQNQNKFEAANRGQGFDLGSLAELIPTALSFINPAAGMGAAGLQNIFGNTSGQELNPNSMFA